jgi:hypothetical protein
MDGSTIEKNEGVSVALILALRDHLGPEALRFLRPKLPLLQMLLNEQIRNQAAHEATRMRLAEAKDDNVSFRRSQKPRPALRLVDVNPDETMEPTIMAVAHAREAEAMAGRKAARATDALVDHVLGMIGIRVQR